MLRHEGTVVIHTAHLLLRPFMTGDAPAMFRNWTSDPMVTRYLSWQPHDSLAHTEKVLSDWLRCYGSDSYYHWGIAYEGELVGAISVVRWNEANEEAELGYCLSRRFWGRGIMTEALQRVMRYLFDTVGFHRIVAKHAVANGASGRVMRKAGLRFEGIHAEAYKQAEGSYLDLAQYAAVSGVWHHEGRKNSA